MHFPYNKKVKGTGTLCPQLPYFCPPRISVIGLMRLFSLKTKKLRGKLCPPQLPYFCPPQRIYVTHFASPGVPLDAPGTECL